MGRTRICFLVGQGRTMCEDILEAILILLLILEFVNGVRAQRVGPPETVTVTSGALESGSGSESVVSTVSAPTPVPTTSGSSPGSKTGIVKGPGRLTMAIHGVLGALAVGILFPLGSILMSVVPGPLALWIHGLAQLFSLTMLIACVGMGIYLVMTFEIPRKDVEEKHLLKNHDTNYHPIMGLAVFFCLLVQPIFGILHHSRFKKLKRRQIWSYFHILNGWVSVTMGIINGALGLSLGPESAKIRRIYIGISAGMWGLWVLSAVWAEVRRRKGVREAPVADGVPLRKLPVFYQSKHCFS